MLPGVHRFLIDEVAHLLLQYRIGDLILIIAHRLDEEPFARWEQERHRVQEIRYLGSWPMPNRRIRRSKIDIGSATYDLDGRRIHGRSLTIGGGHPATIRESYLLKVMRHETSASASVRRRK